ncbi:unnamed protein product [Onchocerca flexuosa]|uniref:Coiled-coil domain-containing protein 176 n=1 Tax=Onchocerca flexuosa TaxID=387005 RepID=A0A183HDM7_9BILA|nr:unnamed protein product [Onchocerca flexuosa]
MSKATSELEKKITDLEKCIESHEAVLHDVLEQYKVKEREMSQALANSKFEIAQLNETVDRIESEHNAELKRIHHEYRETEKKAIIQKKTEIENYDDTINTLRKNKEYLEKSLAVAEEEMKELSLRCENVTFENDKLRLQLDEEKERCEKEMASLRQQLNAIEERYIEEITEWERICAEVGFILSDGMD